MELKHINLTVDNIGETREFLQTYFDFTLKTEAGKNPEVLLGKDGFILTLMQGKDVSYPKTFHIGFPQKSKEDVDNIYTSLKVAGYKVPDPKVTPHGYTFYIKATGNFMIEVLAFI